MKLIECNSQFEEELTKIVFGDDLEFIHSQHVFEQSCLFEDYNPVDTKFVGKYSEIIQGTAHGDWKCESEYFVCRVSKEDIQKLQKMKFLQDLKGGDIYVLFEIGWDDNWSKYFRYIHLLKFLIFYFPSGRPSFQQPPWRNGGASEDRTTWTVVIVQ